MLMRHPMELLGTSWVLLAGKLSRGWVRYQTLPIANPWRA